MDELLEVVVQKKNCQFYTFVESDTLAQFKLSNIAAI